MSINAEDVGTVDSGEEGNYRRNVNVTSDCIGWIINHDDFQSIHNQSVSQLPSVSSVNLPTSASSWKDACKELP